MGYRSVRVHLRDRRKIHSTAADQLTNQEVSLADSKEANAQHPVHRFHTENRGVRYQRCRRQQGNDRQTDKQVHGGFAVDVIDTLGDLTNLFPWRIRANRLTRLLQVAWGSAKKFRRTDVMFRIIASCSALLLASFLTAVCKITRRPLVLHITGAP